MRPVLIVVLAAALVPAAARAERELCPERPGRASAPCTLDAGAVEVETSLADWSHARDADEVEDLTLVGDTLVRVGVARHGELQLGWTAYGVDRSRDRQAGSVDHRRGIGDVTLGFKRNLAGPDGDGPSAAVQGFVALPVGHTPVGAGTWSAGVDVPVLLDLSRAVTLTLQPEVDAAPDEDRDGRHLGYSAIAQVAWKATDAAQFGGEGYVARDDDPAGHDTLASLDLFAAYQFGRDTQIDLSAYRGLTAATPRVELIAGVTRRFR